MANIKILKQISTIGLIIAIIGILFLIYSLIFLSSNTAGLNFKYGFKIPVKMGIWINDKHKSSDSVVIDLLTAKPFALTTFGCPNTTVDIDSIKKLNNQSTLKAQNRFSMIDTELKVKSDNLFINIWILSYNLLPLFFWGILFYMLSMILKIDLSSQNWSDLFSKRLGIIGLLVISYELLLFLISLSFLLFFGGAAYISTSNNLNDLYSIHFHPRIVLNLIGIFIGFCIICLAEIIKHRK